MAGMECKPVSVELTYGLEKFVFTQQKKCFDLLWNNEGIEYREVFHQAEKEFSAYNFEYANTENLFKIFDMLEMEAKSLIEKNIITCLRPMFKSKSYFNILDARGVISVAQRAKYIGRIRDITKGAAEIWVNSQK